MNSVYAPTIKAGIKMMIFMIVTIFLTYILAGTINSATTGSLTSYKAEFTDVTGLLPGDDVRIAGVKVGAVKAIKIHDAKYAQVTFAVDKGEALHTDAQLQVRYRTLVGQRYVALEPGTNGPTMSSGQEVPLSQTKPALDLTTLLNGFKPLFQALDPTTVNDLSQEIIEVFQGEGGTLDTLLAHTASVTNTIADHDQVIGEVIDNLDSALATIAARDGQVTTLIKTLKDLVVGLNADKGVILGELDGVDALARNTTAYLSQVRPPITSDLTKLNTLAGTLDAGKGQIDKELKILPRKLTAIVRTATYGGWFNFYLCKGDGTITLPTGTQIAVKNLIKDSSAACNQDVNAEDIYNGGGSK